MTNHVMQKLQQNSHSLLMMSESESPFEVFFWSGEGQESLTNQKLLQLTNHPAETPIEIVELDYFFRNLAEEKEWHDEIQRQDVQKFKSLVQTLKENLSDIKVYRLGRIDIDVYIFGKTPAGDLAGISTKVIET
ncbi:nuclease A inhibitor family protein [Nostoc sp. FACHB-87]|uniref:nuclease A inhibitor family protein n=1 Tax=Nostocales TaxID=1161 RepID=UPI001687E75A|nr:MULTISPECIES: nuclease A inhibitor family protein [Nostocales]MBD2297489.1 nuclease A inhibitor family protein [Nostoc sp. FACHB-190]MBD2452676.1 nuclease A inhibitor family protein [Nostoc sp. FACHB-87]MBD2473607.1 nuclease A inhibitor family protein [Anabaena sp. FACHB-83]MBD2486272.1 nuclease A inhibitor family protein [Aulosira sp. FACHB-615]